MSSYFCGENLIELIPANNICHSKSKRKKCKRSKSIWMKPWLKNRGDKSGYIKGGLMQI